MHLRTYTAYSTLIVGILSHLLLFPAFVGADTPPSMKCGRLGDGRMFCEIDGQIFIDGVMVASPQGRIQPQTETRGHDMFHMNVS